MFSIIIDETTLELVTAMNEGVEPEITRDHEGAPNSFYVWKGHHDFAQIISSEEMRERIDSDEDWEPLKFAIWRK